MKVGIYGQANNDNTKKYAQILIDQLEENNVEIVFEHKFIQDYQFHKKNGNPQVFKSYADLDHSFDLFFSVGGDGTFLRSITFVKDLNIPIIGINTGRLGFLATIQKEEIKSSLKQILQKDYLLKTRSLLQISTQEVSVDFEGLNFALNEITVTRKNTASMITVETELDNEYLTTYWSDGLIVSTPTGSTGYSLSCGGPIISPSSKNFVLTPIAPHSLSVRPLVIPDQTKIKLKIASRFHEALLTLDSRILTIPNETEIFIKKCNFNIQTVHLKKQSFIETLRGKLFWGEDKRN